jgi:hypothetical protein
MLSEVRHMIDLTNCILFAFVTFAKLSVAEKTDRDRPFGHQAPMFGGIPRSHSITDEAIKSHKS